MNRLKNSEKEPVFFDKTMGLCSLAVLIFSILSILWINDIPEKILLINDIPDNMVHFAMYLRLHEIYLGFYDSLVHTRFTLVFFAVCSLVGVVVSLVNITQQPLVIYKGDKHD